jgi:transcriptional regulator with XRE-family HTH domain
VNQTHYGFLSIEGTLSSINVNIANKLRRLRARSGLSPEQIAPLVGATGGDEIRQYESNNGSICVMVLKTYAEAFGLLEWDIIEDDKDFDVKRLYFKPKKDQDVVSCYKLGSHGK